jgi:hypothetical protein
MSTEIGNKARARLSKITGQDFPAMGCMLTLLADKPRVYGDEVLAGAVSGPQDLFSRLWDDVEVAVGPVNAE